MIKTDKISRRQAIQSLATVAAGALIRPVSIFGARPVQDKVRFAVIGDWGSGSDDAEGIARQMYSTHRRTPFDFVIAAGDNIYPDGDGKRFNKHFELPFSSLLKDRVNFYAVLGNHDVEKGRLDQIHYPLFNMGGKTYYTVKQGDGLVEFFMIDSTDFDSAQAGWLQQALAASTAHWKIAVFHHPVYSSGSKHGSNLNLRRKLEPLFTAHGVHAAFSGHEHIYERTKPQQRVQYFITGAGGKTRRGGVKLDSPIRAASFDEDNHFMVIEIEHQRINFQAISELGRVVDKGAIGNPT